MGKGWDDNCSSCQYLYNSGYTNDGDTCCLWSQTEQQPSQQLQFGLQSSPSKKKTQRWFQEIIYLGESKMVTLLTCSGTWCSQEFRKGSAQYVTIPWLLAARASDKLNPVSKFSTYKNDINYTCGNTMQFLRLQPGSCIWYSGQTPKYGIGGLTT